MTTEEKVDLLELVLGRLDSAAESIAAAVLGARDKEPDQLTDIERAAIAISGGAKYEFTNVGILVTEPFAIQKINGQFRVATRAPK